MPSKYVRNTENLNVLLHWLKNGGQHMQFDLGTLISIDDNGPDCGTVCCIAGAAAQFAGHTPERVLGMCPEEVVSVACAYLGMNVDDADALFQMETNPCDLRGVTTDKAYNVLTAYAETGNIDWGYL